MSVIIYIQYKRQMAFYGGCRVSKYMSSLIEPYRAFKFITYIYRLKILFYGVDRCMCYCCTEASNLADNIFIHEVNSHLNPHINGVNTVCQLIFDDKNGDIIHKS